MQYAIFEGNMERLMKKINRIKAKCLKYGCDFHFEEVGEEFREIPDPNVPAGFEALAKKRIARFVLVEVEGVAVVNGWRFIASVEHTDTAQGNIIRAACNIEVPERFYHTAPICEHCNSNRTRKDTYIVMNEETGEFKQVGKSCLLDFTHGMSATGVAQYISLFDELIAGEAPYEGVHWERYYDKVEFLQYVAETIRHFGYVKYDPEDAYKRTTKERAEEYYRLNHGGFTSFTEQAHRRQLEQEMESVSFRYDSPEAVQATTEALNWVKDQGEDSNYIHNLKTACSLEIVTWKHLGILASLFPAFNKATAKKAEQEKREQQAKAEAAKSQYVGNLKERITVDVQSITCVTSWETEYGVTRIYKILDMAGNVFIWKTGVYFEEAKVKKITGTVKGHNEFRGVKQTEITRCKVA